MYELLYKIGYNKRYDLKNDLMYEYGQLFTGLSRCTMVRMWVRIYGTKLGRLDGYDLMDKSWYDKRYDLKNDWMYE